MSSPPLPRSSVPASASPSLPRVYDIFAGDDGPLPHQVSSSSEDDNASEDNAIPNWLRHLDATLPLEPIRDWSLCWNEAERRAAGFKGLDFFLMSHRPPTDVSQTAFPNEAARRGLPSSRAATRVYYDSQTERIHGAVRFGTCAEGSPTLAHGGCVATVWDEVLNIFNLKQRVPRFTASLNVDYRAPTPLCKVHRVEAWIEEGVADGRKLVSAGRMYDGSTGKLLSEARAVWVSAPEAAYEADEPETKSARVLKHLFTHPPHGPPIAKL